MFDIHLHQRQRHILHIDADAFFASVEQILNPALRGKAVLVGGPTDTNGIVSAASYEARKFGIKSGMAMYLAKRKCPGAIVVHGNFDAYRNFSRRMYKIFCEFTPDVEMASIDEAYLDITGCCRGEGWAMETVQSTVSGRISVTGDTFCDHDNHEAETLARRILMEIYKKLGLSVSCGMASSKMVAKVASSTYKPHKLSIVPYGKERDFLAPLQLRAMPGIGPKTFEVLSRVGLTTLGNLSSMKMTEVIDKLGVGAVGLWKRACGVDNSEVISTQALPKSISKEHTFYQRETSKKNLLRELKNLSVMVFEKLRKYRMKASTICIKIRYFREGASSQWHRDNAQIENLKPNIFQDFSFQKHLDFPTCSDKKLFMFAKNLFLENLADEPVRLIGIGVSGLKQNYNLTIFERDEEEEGLFYSIDKIRQAYGEDALKYGVD
ncbi:DNA polymerase IV [Candidatus Peregrinibacteria bacterium]|nr:DNA polymerase IV [Candidatus Peregrinibacteria bacterium]